MNDKELNQVEHELASIAMANSASASVIHEDAIRRMVRSLCKDRRDLRCHLAKMQVVMQEIQLMAAEEIRVGAAEGTFLHQIEANAREALKDGEA